jgi:hypothetical protein
VSSNSSIAKIVFSLKMAALKKGSGLAFSKLMLSKKCMDLITAAPEREDPLTELGRRKKKIRAGFVLAQKKRSVRDFRFPINAPKTRGIKGSY